jgi:hypothetical protein
MEDVGTDGCKMDFKEKATGTDSHKLSDYQLHKTLRFTHFMAKIFVSSELKKRPRKNVVQ